jgi:hypothetical protein
LRHFPGFWFGFSARTVRLDGLAAIGDLERVEEEAAPFLGSKTSIEPFALRALGIVREDEDLLATANERFRTLKLDWHAGQTETLRRFRNLAAG